MSIEHVFADKSLTSKKKAKALSESLISAEVTVETLLNYARHQTGNQLATCIEAIEDASKKDSSIVNKSVLDFATNTLSYEEPRVKWESARVIGNIASQFPDNMEVPIEQLLRNATHDGSVVRWATAYALGEILKIKTDHNAKLVPEIESLCEHENDDAVTKKYLAGLKAAKK